MYLGFWRPIALKPAPLLGVGRKCALELSNSGEKIHLVNHFPRTDTGKLRRNELARSTG